MLKGCCSRSIVFSRSFGGCLGLSKPLDLGENSARAGGNRHLESLLINRTIGNKQEHSGGRDNKDIKLGFSFHKNGEKARNTTAKGYNNNNNSNNHNNNSHNNYNRSNNKNRHHGNHNNGNNTRSSRKLARFEFNTGTLQAQNALKSIITKVHAYDSSYRVKYLDPVTKKISNTHLVDIVNNLDLSKFGITMIPDKDSHQLPLIKQISIVEMVKAYTDGLAELKEQELISKGSITMQKILQNRLRAEKKKSAIKTLNMQWNINVGDLKNQKKSEIESRLLKGENFNIYIKSKNNRHNTIDDLDLPESEQISFDITKNNKFKDEDDLILELRKRDLILTSLKSILDDLPCQYEVKGKVETSIMIPLVSTVNPKELSKSCEIKKSSKSEKSKQRQDKKQVVKKPKCEEDLDALYLFKIED